MTSETADEWVPIIRQETGGGAHVRCYVQRGRNPDTLRGIHLNPHRATATAKACAEREARS